MATKSPRLSQKRKLEDIVSESELQKKRIKEAGLTTTAGQLEAQGFVVELFFDEQKRLHSTHVLDVKSGEEEKWSGWDEHRLLAFLAQRAGLTAPTRKPAPSTATTSSGGFALREMSLHHQANGQATRLLRVGAPLSLDLSLVRLAVPAKPTAEVDYQVYLSAESVASKSKYPIVAEQGVLTEAAEGVTVQVPQLNLPPGTYHFQAAVFLAAGTKQTPYFDYSSLSRVYQVF